MIDSERDLGVVGSAPQSIQGVNIVVASPLRDRIFQCVTATREVISDPESPSLQEFHSFLTGAFREGEVEPLDVFKEEMKINTVPNSSVRFLCVVFRDPLDDNRIVSCAYGSVQHGILAVRFTLTEANINLGKLFDEHAASDATASFDRGYRGFGISQALDSALLEEANKYQNEQTNKDCDVIICEAVDASESYWNRMEIEPGIGMRRLYTPGILQQIYYRLPPLSWNRDGTPKSQDVLVENLQMGVKGCMSEISVEKLEDILTKWWQVWYIRPKSYFDDEAAWERHRQTVLGILRDEIMASINHYDTLTFMTRAERKG